MREGSGMKTILSVFTIPALAFAAAAEGALELKIQPERELLLIGGSRDCVLQVEVCAKPVEKKRSAPLNLALVLDRSGSMAGAKLEKARQAACVAVDQLGPDDFFSLVVYDDTVEVLIPPQKVKDKKEIKNAIGRIQEGGSTALYAGVEKGAAQLRKYFDKEKVNRIILLSDGIANVGPSSPSDLSKLGKELRTEGLSVSTVGLGDDYNEDLMTALAEASHANYYYVKDAEKLPGIFSEELGTVKSIAARNVRLRIVLPKGVSSATVIGENEISFRDGTLTIPLSEFFGSQTRRFLIACQAPDSDSPSLELAKVELTYDDAETGMPVNTALNSTVRQSRDEKAVRASLRAEVASHAAITRNRLAKEEAVRLADAGKPEDAADLLQRQVQANTDLPAEAQSSLLAKDNIELKLKASELKSWGFLSRTSRKEIQYENYQDKNQKR